MTRVGVLHTNTVEKHEPRQVSKAEVHRSTTLRVILSNKIEAMHLTCWADLDHTAAWCTPEDSRGNRPTVQYDPRDTPDNTNACRLERDERFGIFTSRYSPMRARNGDYPCHGNDQRHREGATCDKRSSCRNPTVVTQHGQRFRFKAQGGTDQVAVGAWASSTWQIAVTATIMGKPCRSVQGHS